MKLSEKICYCRKKSGKSQEALAEAIGVSRQAISKWETGDAEPEVRKLRLLAETFEVSVDWLLSEEPLPEEAPAAAPTPAAAWVDAIPGAVGRLLRRYGWLMGVYTALSGGGIALLGFLARAISRSMFRSFENFAVSSFPGSSVHIFDSAGNPMNPADIGLFDTSPFSSFAASNPVSLLGGAMLVIGLLILIAGIVLAVVLKRQADRQA